MCVYSSYTYNWKAIKYFFSFPCHIKPECDYSHIRPKRLKLTGFFLRPHLRTTDGRSEHEGNETNPHTIFHKVTPYCIVSLLVRSRDEQLAPVLPVVLPPLVVPSLHQGPLYWSWMIVWRGPTDRKPECYNDPKVNSHLCAPKILGHQALENERAQ